MPGDILASRRVGLVLGGGGLKGFAHIGALRALEERNVVPQLIAGSSIGSLIAAAVGSGMPSSVMAGKAVALRRRDLFRINHFGMAFERMRSPSIYLDGPLLDLVEDTCSDVTLAELSLPVLVNTVDVERGTQVVWGLPGLADVSAREAVYASCALPGFFPPGNVGERTCVDGGTMDNMPVRAAAAYGADVLIAMDVGNSDLAHAADVSTSGFASIFMRSASIMMRHLQLHPLETWGTPPMLLVRPRVSHIPWFAFGHAEELIESGYRAMLEALDHLGECMEAEQGIFPRREVQLSVDREACIGCGLCAVLAPDTMALGEDRIAYPRKRDVLWSPADGDFVRQCPTNAIHAESDEPVLQSESEAQHADSPARAKVPRRLRRRKAAKQQKAVEADDTLDIAREEDADDEVRVERPRVRPRATRGGER